MADREHSPLPSEPAPFRVAVFAGAGFVVGIFLNNILGLRILSYYVYAVALLAVVYVLFHYLLYQLFRLYRSRVRSGSTSGSDEGGL